MGYTQKTGGECLKSAVHLGHWVASEEIDISALDERSIAGFEAHLPGCGYPFGRIGKHSHAVRNARVFLRFLRTFDIAPSATQPPQSPVLDGFGDWLRRQKGVTERTVCAYGYEIKELFGRLGEDPSRYSAQALRAVIVSLVTGHGPGKAERVLTAARAFLRWQAAIGGCSPDLIGALPKVPRWSQTTLPKYLPAEEVELLIGSCETATLPGLRDRAILLLLARLGLRAGDIVALRLSDIDWIDASIKVTGKGRQEARLPLSQEVGDAILAYLDQGRPRIDLDHVFLAIGAPWRPLGGSSAVGGIVARAILRAGINAPIHGAHLLRHSAATSMLRQGASLYAIGTLLRHQSLETTAQYARVDSRALLRVAQPWPEAGTLPGDGEARPSVKARELGGKAC